MSLKAPNVANPKKAKRVAIVISNPAVSRTTGWPVGFRWSDLSHPFFFLSEKGYAVDVFSLNGGKCEADAMSDPSDPGGYSDCDIVSLGLPSTPKFDGLIEYTRKVSSIDVAAYDAIIVAGGQGPMFSFEKPNDLQRKFVEFYETGKKLGDSLRTSNGKLTPPAIISFTWIQAREEAERDRVREHSRAIVSDFLKQPGFIGIVPGLSGNRGFTCTAWENEKSLHDALDQNHARAKQDFRTSGLSPGVWTSVWKPHHINAVWVRCLTCEQPNDVTDRHPQCTKCGSELPPPPT